MTYCEEKQRKKLMKVTKEQLRQVIKERPKLPLMYGEKLSEGK